MTHLINPPMVYLKSGCCSIMYLVGNVSFSVRWKKLEKSTADTRDWSMSVDFLLIASPAVIVDTDKLFGKSHSSLVSICYNRNVGMKTQKMLEIRVIPARDSNSISQGKNCKSLPTTEVWDLSLPRSLNGAERRPRPADSVIDPRFRCLMFLTWGE